MIVDILRNIFRRKETKQVRRYHYDPKDSLMICDLNNRIEQIKEQNSKYLIRTKYIPKVIKDTLEIDGYLIGENAALNLAVNRFIIDKKQGKIDELNNLVEQKENV
jgi:hypothetical protein